MHPNQRRCSVVRLRQYRCSVGWSVGECGCWFCFVRWFCFGAHGVVPVQIRTKGHTTRERWQMRQMRWSQKVTCCPKHRIQSPTGTLLRGAGSLVCPLKPLRRTKLLGRAWKRPSAGSMPGSERQTSMQRARRKLTRRAFSCHGPLRNSTPWMRCFGKVKSYRAGQSSVSRLQKIARSNSDSTQLATKGNTHGLQRQGARIWALWMPSACAEKTRIASTLSRCVSTAIQSHAGLV